MAAAGLAVGTAAVALGVSAGMSPQQQTSSTGVSADPHHALEAIAHAPDGAELVLDGASAVTETAGEAASGALDTLSNVGDIGDLASGALEMGGAVLEGAGEVLGAVLEALSGL